MYVPVQVPMYITFDQSTSFTDISPANPPHVINVPAKEDNVHVLSLGHAAAAAVGVSVPSSVLAVLVLLFLRDDDVLGCPGRVRLVQDSRVDLGGASAPAWHAALVGVAAPPPFVYPLWRGRGLLLPSPDGGQLPGRRGRRGRLAACGLP